MIEIIVVMAIILVLLGIGVLTLRSSRESSNGAVLRATASSYAEAVESFARDNAGRYPRAVGSADWPVAGEGPRSPLARRLGGRYLRTIPDAVQDGRVRIGADGKIGRIDMIARADRSGYELRVLDVDGQVICALGEPTPVSVQSCVE